MIRFDTKQAKYVPYLYKMYWDSYGQPMVRYTDDQQYWLRFNNKYWHQSTPVFKPVVLTEEQQIRLDEVNGFNTQGEWEGEFTLYVEFGAVDPESECPHLSDKVGTPAAQDGLCQIQRESLLRRLASIRYQQEVGGLTLPDGTHIATDRASQAILAAAKQSLDRPYITSIDWKGESGWVEINESNIDFIAETVVKHVQRCFSAERLVHDLITGETDLEVLSGFDVAGAFTATYEDLYNQ